MKLALIVVPIGLLFQVAPAEAAASNHQAQPLTAAGMASPRPQPARPPAVQSGVLQRTFALELDAVTLDEALQAIARRGGVRLIYNEAVVPLTKRVSLRSARISVGEALARVLQGTDVEPKVASTGEIALVRAARSHKPISATGSITGRVIDEKTGQGLPAAEVLLEKTRWRGTTDSSGRYRLVEVDSGHYTLSVRRFGYAKQSRTVTVAEGRTDTVDLALEPVATRLNDVVTTVTGRRRRVELGNDITTINADSVVRMEPVKSVTDLLETRVPGLSVQHTSGAPGDPSRLRLRGAASPLRSNDPIVVVDGIRIYAEQSAARSANLAGGTTGTLINSGTPYAAPSPLDNIDPNTIETIEVIKGPSAATLYGQDAANGVIVITTKKGKAGPPRWTASAEHGTTRLEGDYPELMQRWGHTLQNSVPVGCPTSNLFGSSLDPVPCVGDSIVRFQLLNDPALTVLDKGQSTRATLGVSGGTAALTYAVTGSYGNETGLPKLPAYEADRYQALTGTPVPDWMRRPQHLTEWSVTSNIGARLGAHADVGLSTSLTRTMQQRSDLENQLGQLMGTYLDRATGTYYRSSITEAFGNLGITIVPVDNTSVLTGYFSRVTDDALTLTNGVAANWRPRDWLTLTAEAGLNWIQRSDQLYLPREANGVGAVNYGRGSSLLSTANLRGNILRPLGYGFHFQFAAGANYAGTAINDLVVRTTNLPEGTSLIGSTGDAGASKTNDATFGWYVEPGINNNRLFLNLGLRLDGGSSYGGSVTTPKFPKLGFSYLISDEPFYPFKNLIPTLRLRLAYGRASRQPGVTDHLRLYGARQSVWVDNTAVTGVFLQHIGNADLRPERTTDLEGGLDADFLDNRLSVTFSGYRKTTDDALLSVPVPPSVYGDGVSQFRNIGVVRNTGLELSVDGQLIRSGPLTWGVGVWLSHNRNVVVRLGPGVEPFSIVDDGGVRIVPGYPLFGRWVPPILGYADANGNGVIDQDEILVGDTAVYAGATDPDYQANVRTNLSLWRGAVIVSANLEYKNGLSQKNDVAQHLAAFSPGWNDPTVSRAEQVATSTVTAYNWIQTVNTTRLTSVSVNYRVPMAVARRVGAQMLSVAVQGTNLGLWTNYRGLDPNVNAFSTGNGVLDTGVLPEPRLWQVRVNATY